MAGRPIYIVVVSLTFRIPIGPAPCGAAYIGCVMTHKKQFPEIAQRGRAYMVTDVGRGPAGGWGWAYEVRPGEHGPKNTHQRRRAYATGRWMLRGQLMRCHDKAVIRRPEGYWHFLNGEWQGPYNWREHTAPGKTVPIVPVPVREWVTVFGRLPDLPLPTPVPRPPFEPYWHYYHNRWHGPTGRNCHPAECRIHVHGLARPVGNPPPAPPPMTREDIIFLARVISDMDDPAERASASRDFAATDHKTKGKFDQGDVRFGRLIFTAPKRQAPNA
jgi:hypothetical protein